MKYLLIHKAVGDFGKLNSVLHKTLNHYRLVPLNNTFRDWLEDIDRKGV